VKIRTRRFFINFGFFHYWKHNQHFELPILGFEYIPAQPDFWTDYAFTLDLLGFAFVIEWGKR